MTAQVFKGWNVWAVLRKNDLSLDPLMVGVSDDRRLRIWVESAADAAPGVAVADPANPFALRGGQVEMLQSAEGLEPAAEAASEMPGQIPLLFGDEPSTRLFVRFFNRGKESVTPWPHDSDFFLDTIYQPDPANALTNSDAPGSLAGAAGDAADKVGGALKVIAIVAGVGLGALLIAQIVQSTRKAAA
jgi:hypothetical protein